MPYYLVTHTSLLEAEDEVKSAQKALMKLKSDATVEFTVKFDDTNIRQVLVTDTSLTASRSAEDPRPKLQAMQTIDCRPPVIDRDEICVSTHWPLTAKGFIVGFGLFAAGLSIGVVIDRLS